MSLQSYKATNAQQGGEPDAPPLMEFVVDFWNRVSYQFRVEDRSAHGGSPVSFDVVQENENAPISIHSAGASGNPS